MSFLSMQMELRGAVPKLPISYAPTIINRAWKWVRQSHLWSFNLVEWAWISPPPVTIGACTFTQGFPAITFNSAAVAAINASVIANPYAPVTVQQIRAGNVAGVSGIYNIIQYNSTTGAATLDRIFADPSGVNTSFTLYQNYYPAPVKDFLAPLSVRNMTMFLDMELFKTRAWIDARDPQRSWYQFPTHVVPFMQDLRGGGTADQSGTYGFMLYELWGIPVSPFTYTGYGVRRGVDLLNPGDLLPEGVGEDLIMALARYYAYEWAEANKSMSPRSQGPDFRFLMGETQSTFGKLLIQYRREDKERVDNYFSVRQPDIASRAFGYYNTIAGVAGPYSQG